MKKEDVLNEVISGIEKRDWNKVEENLSEDFTFSGAVQKPIGKKEWLKANQALQTGMPDMRFNLQQVSPNGDDKLRAKVKFTGTHVYEIPALFPGFQPVKPPTASAGKKVELPEEEVEVTFKGDKISDFFVKPVAHGGFQGILEQLGGATA